MRPPHPIPFREPKKPHAVEQTVQGKIAGVAVRGIVDLLDVDGCVFDFKTSSKRPNGIPAELMTKKINNSARRNAVNRSRICTPRATNLKQRNQRLRQTVKSLKSHIEGRPADNRHNPSPSPRLVMGAVEGDGQAEMFGQYEDVRSSACEAFQALLARRQHGERR